MKHEYKIAVVAPLHKVPKQEWIDALNKATYGKADVIFVDDSPAQNLREAKELGYAFSIYNRADAKKELGKKYTHFALFHKSSACRNFGNYMAWKLDYDIIIGLDSDCNVPEDFIEKHIEGLLTEGYGWTNPIKWKGWYPRGYPYSERIRRVVANLGLWTNVLDINAKDRASDEPTTPFQVERYEIQQLVAESFIPFSGMNWAMWREAMPGFIFLPNFNLKFGEEEYKFRRHDDIWGGYIFQKLMELRNERIAYGLPFVHHDTEIDVEADTEEEKAMIEFENVFYTAVDAVVAQIQPGDYYDMMLQFSEIVSRDWIDTEWQSFIEPIKWWAEIFLYEEKEQKEEGADIQPTED
jgi:hypothetical protein